MTFFFFFPLVMQNYFIQEKKNHINDKNYTPKRFILKFLEICWGRDNFGPPER